ncbi:trypsin-like peptidase domain-containing protein [Porticoccus sp. W117]|uniref:trypsin-like peptidase domain-containing protein n=1 Tax=Porticoccus sp. W117 TaxID=3054777 RepID=UPI002599172B|nr:trypsin-like peptidase domain-containing protein [Porticoccus sp. W117]MDM3869776.1 trypsin-like peptidase domain-containing protein [Porticoccus sp. W117]
MKPTHLALSATLLLSTFSFAATADQQLNPRQLQQSIDKVVAKVSPATVEVRTLGRGGNGTFSAVIVSPEGYVMSAGHAVRPNARYEILLADGRSFTATGLGTEPHVDMGVIKIDKPGDLPVAELGWSSALERNQPCISLGFPGEHSEQRGVVVRFGYIADPVTDDGYIQSTCLMEPGDSGGPLYDMEGRLIGIHSNISQSLDRNHEVPVDQFRRYWDYLIRAEEFHDHNVSVGPDFGFELAEGNEHRRRSSRTDYAKVAAVTPDSLAQKSGLQAGDRLLAVDGEEARQRREAHLLLQRAYTLKKDQVSLRVKRDGSEVELTFKLPENKRSYHAWSGTLAVNEQAPTVKPVAPQTQLVDLEQQFSGQEQRLQSASLQVVSEKNGEQVEALATLFRPGNLLVSKSSRVGDSISVTQGGESYDATVVARDSERDLVLLKLATRLKGGLKLSARGSDKIDRGQLLLSPHPKGDGLVSVKSTEQFAIDKRHSAGYLGVSPSTVNGKVRFDRVFDDTPAAKQFRDGDFLLEVDGKQIASAQQLIETLRGYEPGDSVSLVALRNDEPLSVELVLGNRPQQQGRHVAEYFDGGKSIRRDGFENVFSHDAPLHPDDCGGPLFSVDGIFAGVNIARYSRTRSYAIPAADIVEFVKDNR